MGAGDGGAGVGMRGIWRNAVVKSHNNIGADIYLRLSGQFGSKEMFGAVEVGSKFNSFVGNFGVQTMDLKTAGVGEDGVGPIHEFMNAAKFLNIF